MYQKNGQFYVRSWPRKLTAKQKKKAEPYWRLFAGAVYLAKYADASQQEFARTFAKTDQYNTRDFLIQSMYGRLRRTIQTDQSRMYSVLLRNDISFMLDIPHVVYRALPHSDGTQTFNINDPRTWWMATLTDLSALLDVITDTPGAMLVRGASVWEAVAPGAADQILTGAGSPVMPTWADPAPVNPRYYMSSGLISGTAQSAAVPFCGQIITPGVNMTAKGVMYTLTQVNGGVYHCELWSLSGNTLGTKLASTTGFTSAATTVKTTYELWNSAAALVAGTDYVIAMIRTDGTDTSVIGAHFAAFQWGAIPLSAVPNTNISLAKKAPAAGQAITRTTSANSFCMAIDTY